MNKRGQLQLSFGMIFSIIIIIATIGVAFYVISNFLHLARCVDSAKLYTSLDERIDRAWKAPITNEMYSIAVPSGVEKICFGNIREMNRDIYEKEYESLRYYTNQKANIFIYPTNKACGNSLVYYNLEKTKIEGFFCIDADNGKVNIKINKEFDDTLVTLTK